MADAGSYSGAKLAILCKGRVLTMLRDDHPDISFGNEGQKWLLMPVRMYFMHPKAIPHLAKRLAMWLEQRTKASLK